MKFLYKLLFLTAATTAIAIAREKEGLPDNGCVDSIPEGGNPANVSLSSNYSSSVSNM